MIERVEYTIEPNEKYKRVIGLMSPSTDDSPNEKDDPNDWEEWPDEHKEAADDFTELVATAPTPDDYGIDENEVDVLTWDDISPSSDPDLLSKVATYFAGLEADEPKDLLRAKCRLLDVDVYVNAQMAAREELRN